MERATYARIRDVQQVGKGDVVAWDEEQRGDYHYSVVESTDPSSGTLNVIMPGPYDKAIRHVEDIYYTPVYKVDLPSGRCSGNEAYQNAIRYFVKPLSSIAITVTCKLFASVVTVGLGPAGPVVGSVMCNMCHMINDKIKSKKLRG